MDEQREAFERAYEAYLMPAESDWFKLDEDGDYWYSTTSSAWWGWQAALSSAPSAEPVGYAVIEVDGKELFKTEKEAIDYASCLFGAYVVPLYTAPPHLSAAVAAAREQAARAYITMCEKLDQAPCNLITDAIRAQQDPDELAALREALAELVALKAMKDEMSHMLLREEGGMGLDYDRRKPLAWQRARELVGYFEGCKEEFKSASLDDVLQLRQKLDTLTLDNQRLREALEKIKELDGTENDEWDAVERVIPEIIKIAAIAAQEPK